MEQFKHLRPSASIRKSHVKLVAIGIILITVLLLILNNRNTMTDTDYYDTPDSAGVERLACLRRKI